MNLLLCIILALFIGFPISASKTCDNDVFQCDNKKCVPLIWRCDSSDDCGDGSDEVGCSKPVISQPPPALVHLSLNDTLNLMCTGVGVPTPVIGWKFNGSFIPPKCTTSSVNGTGILVCENMRFGDQGKYTCKANNIKGAVFAVPDTVVMVQNKSSSDSENSTESVTSCQSNEFRCKNNRCIFWTFKCDGDNDCLDGSDEIDCPMRGCIKNSEFQCKDKKCVPLAWRCDTEKDCPDGSDEIGCDTNTHV